MRAGSYGSAPCSKWRRCSVFLLGFLFEQQDRLRPGFRRLISDTTVGKSARYWLEILGNAGDVDIFPNGRQTAPKHEVKEVDLVEAIKATARPLNFLSSKAKPDILTDELKASETPEEQLHPSRWAR